MMLEAQNRIDSASGKNPSAKNTYFHTNINLKRNITKKKNEISKQVYQTVFDKD